MVSPASEATLTTSSPFDISRETKLCRNECACRFCGKSFLSFNMRLTALFGVALSISPPFKFGQISPLTCHAEPNLRACSSCTALCFSNISRSTGESGSLRRDRFVLSSVKAKPLKVSPTFFQRSQHCFENLHHTTEARELHRYASRALTSERAKRVLHYQCQFPQAYLNVARPHPPPFSKNSASSFVIIGEVISFGLYLPI